MNVGFNFYETMSDIREQIFLGDNSEVFSIFCSVAGLAAAIYLVKLTNDMTSGREVSPMDILRPFVLALLICNFGTFVLTPLEGVTTLVGKGVTACFDNEKDKTRHLAYMQDVARQYEAYQKERTLSGRLEQYGEDAPDEQVEGFQMSSSQGKEVDIENSVMGEEKTSGWSKAWDFMKAVVGGVFGMKVRTSEMVITAVSSWIVTLVGFVLTGVSCIYLVILGLLGPLVFAISMVPNFHNSMLQWLARYIQISLWTPIVYIVQFANMKLTDACASAYLGTVSSATNIPLLTFIVINLIAIVAMFSVPSVAGWVIQSTGANNVQRGLSQGATYIVMAVSKFL